MEDDTVYIIDAKIQKQRLNDMKNAAKRKNIQIIESYKPGVRYIVTEHKELAPVLKKLGLSSQDDLVGSEVVTLAWFSASLRAGALVPVEPAHRIQPAPAATNQASEVTRINSSPSVIPDYACQRSTPLEHPNERFTTALEVLEKSAELRDTDQDYSRALAFRRASCALKSLPFTLTDIRQLNNVTHIGGHSKRVLQELLEDSDCQEVSRILADPWFHKMKLFTAVFGVGTATAKKWIEKGWTSIQEAQLGSTSSDWRVNWGLAFHDDLITPVDRREAEYILDVVKRHLRKVCPGAIFELTGGFRRGKKQGHDVDILITHPEIGRENGCLVHLLRSLQSCDFILCGNHEKSTFSDDVLVKDFKLSAKGQLDHFEKWLGIVKIPKTVKDNCMSGDDDHIDDGSDQISPAAAENKIKHLDDCKDEQKDAMNPGKVNKNGLNDDSAESAVDVSAGTFETQAKAQRWSQRPDKCPLEQSREPREWRARRVDLILSPYDQYYYALVGWTGNKQFNRDLRTYAPKVKNMKLTSHGLYDLVKGVKIPAASEEEVFGNLGLTFRQPWERNC